MASDKFYIGQNDTADDLVRVLTKADGSVIDLTGCTVDFRMINKVSDRIITGACTVTSEAGGMVTYEWQPGDTSEAGDHSGKFYVTYPSTQIGTVPNNDEVTIVVDAEIPSA